MRDTRLETIKPHTLGDESVIRRSEARGHVWKKEQEKLKDEVKLDDNDEFSDSLNSIMDIAFSLMKEPLKEIESKEPEMIEIIKSHIKSNKQKYSESESVLSKYIWIDELLKWIQDETSSELKFKYLYK